MARHRLPNALAVLLALPGPCSAAPVVIEGVPRTGWAVGHFTPTVDSLHAALAALGCSTSYEELMVVSGAAFQTAWWPERYSYLAVDAVPEDVTTVAAAAVGATAQPVEFVTLDAAWEAVCRSLDEGRPCLFRRGNSFGVACGYDTDGRKLLKRDHNTGGTAPDSVPFDIPKPPWPLEGGRQVVLLNYDRAQPPRPLDWPAILDRAIRYADWPPDERVLTLYVFGLMAYGTWADTLRQGPDANGPQTAAEFLEFMLQHVAEARTCAAIVLRENAYVHPSLADAATLYEDEAGLLTGALPVLRRDAVPALARQGLVDLMAANFGDDGLREELAQIVEQAGQTDREAVDLLRQALQDLQGSPATEARAPDDPPVTAPPAEDKTALAREHCAKGRDLKGAGQFEAAAKELRRALEADPNLADAHWILGWVLVELKDDPGATEAFKAVIRLEAGTDRAQEAQKALDRLGP